MNTPRDLHLHHRLQDAIAALPALAERIGEDAAAREVRRVLPYEGFARFRESGLGLLRIPAEWGGLGGSLVNLFETITTLAAHESNVAHALRIHYDLTEVIRLSPLTAFHQTQLDRLLAGAIDRKSTRLNSSHIQKSRMPSSA